MLHACILKLLNCILLHAQLADDDIIIKRILYPIVTVTAMTLKLKCRCRRSVNEPCLDCNGSGKYENIIYENYSNKKVLLRECKRHTDHSVSSTTRWGTPPPIGVPPPARSDGGYPRWGSPPDRVPPSQVPLGGVPKVGSPHLDRCVSKHNLPSYYARGR